MCVLIRFPHLGDSNEHIQHTISNINRNSPKIIPNTILSAAMGLKIEITVVNESSVFEPLKFYCNNNNNNSNNDNNKEHHLQFQQCYSW